MKIIVNNSYTELEPKSVLNDLMISLKLAKQKGIAIALNNEVIPRNNWNRTELKNNDKITIIKATQGG